MFTRFSFHKILKQNSEISHPGFVWWSIYRYKVENLVAEENYVVDLSVQVCLEIGQPCVIDEIIAQGMSLPKQHCTFDRPLSGKYMYRLLKGTTW